MTIFIQLDVSESFRHSWSVTSLSFCWQTIQQTLKFLPNFDLLSAWLAGSIEKSPKDKNVLRKNEVFGPI